MSLRGRLEHVQEINSPGVVLFETFGIKKNYLPKICPNHIPVTKLVKGNWGEVGCTILVHYLLDGKEITSEETVEAVDEENKSITYNFYEGDLMKLYKKLRITFQAISNDEMNFVKLIYEYEKLNSDVPPPSNLKDFAFEVTCMVDEHYMKLKRSCHAQP